MAIMDDGRPARNGGRKVSVEPQRDDPLRFDQELLTEEEKQALRVKAREMIIAEQKRLLSDALLAEYTKEARLEFDPKKQTMPILLRLAGHAQCIMLDGHQFFTDQVYHVTTDVAHVLIEQMNRGWAHEELTEVRDQRTRNRWRPPMGIGYGNFMDNRQPRNMRLSSSELEGAVAHMHQVLHG